MKRMTEKAIELLEPFTPGIVRPMVCMHAASRCRDTLRHGQPTLLDWALSERNLVAFPGAGDTGSARSS